MHVWEVLRTKGRDVHTVRPSQTVAEAIKQFVMSRIRSVVVTDHGKVVGVLTIRDILMRLDQRGGAALKEQVKDAMTTDVISVTPQTTLDEAEDIFARNQFHHLPVVENGKENGELVGLITPADVLLRHLHDVQDSNERLLTYISGGYC